MAGADALRNRGIGAASGKGRPRRLHEQSGVAAEPARAKRETKKGCIGVIVQRSRCRSIGSPPVYGGSTAEGGEGGGRSCPLHHASHGPPPPLRGGGAN